MIKALVLDYGNVISEPQDLLSYERMSRIAGIDRKHFTDSVWKYRSGFDRGVLGGKEMYLRVLEDAGLREETARMEELAQRILAEDLASWQAVSADVTEWALSVQARGYKLGILSNMPWEFLEGPGKDVLLFSRADCAVFSCEVNIIKPEAEIYQVLIKRLGLKPEEIVFFDDLEPNVHAARAEGIKAILWEGLEKAREEFEKIAQGVT